MKNLKIKINKRLLNTILFMGAVGFGILLFAFVVSATWIGQGVKENCQDAQRQYSGDCVEALSAVLEDENNSYRERNSAIWSLGQIGDPRAWELLQNYYTGVIPPRESQDADLSQYELKKAIQQVSGGLNITRWPWAGSFTTHVDYDPAILTESVVVAKPGDAYYTLAEEIAKAEEMDIVSTFTETMNLHPRYILLVAEPANLTQERLVNIGRIFKKLDTYPGLGIISGSSLAEAKALWQHGKEAQSGPAYLGTDIEKGQLVWQPTLFDLGSEDAGELTQDSLTGALSQANYIYWARHVSSNKWFWNTNAEVFGDDDKLTVEEVPQIPATVVYTPSCGSFQPWQDDSIALAFVDNGAAAYAGHMHSPVTNGFIMQQGLSVPGRYTWDGFPFGIVNQVENRMGARVDYATPMAFMLGDPRLFQLTEPPYQIISDNVDESGERVIHGKSNISGYLPVKIEGGADYGNLELAGVDAISQIDLFFNNNLHSLDLGDDKYLLMIHDGGEFELRLSRDIPMLWWAWDSLRDALDYSWVALSFVYSPFALVFIALFALILYRKYRRGNTPMSAYRPVFLAALVITSMKFAYMLVRINRYSVYASIADYAIWEMALGFLGNFAIIAGGLVLMIDAKKKIGRISGALVAALPQLLLTFMYLGYISYINIVFLSINPVPMPLFNYNAFWLPLSVLLTEIAIYFAISSSLSINYKEN